MTTLRHFSRAGWIGLILLGTLGVVLGLDSSRLASSKLAPVSALDNVLQPAYVGKEACARCHAEIAHDHEQTGHAHTLQADELCDRFASLIGQATPDPEREATFRFECTDGELVLLYDGPGGKIQMPIQFALGSGKHATTFLTLMGNSNEEPVAVEHRLSLFHQEKEVGLTPSHAGLAVKDAIDCVGRRKYGRDVTTCIACHSTTGQVNGRLVDDLRAGVGCESCHGPGHKHVSAMESGRTTSVIAFGKGKSTAEEELHLCGRCHRSTESLSTLPDPDDPKLARFQPVGLRQSSCFRRSDGALKCSTCHDPHRPVKHDPEVFNATCVKCHDGVSSKHPLCSMQKRNGCIECHMPAVEVHPGISFHDHWIRKRTLDN